jgi:cobalt-zinc-cadmium efflux system outer membrane protein
MKKWTLLSICLAGCGAQPLEPGNPNVYGPPAAKVAPTAQDALTVKSLSLEGAETLAETLHPDLSEAKARVEAARGRADQARLYPNPSLITRMESAPFKGKTVGDSELLAGLSQGLPIGGRLGAASRVEELDRDRLEKDFEVRRLEIRTRVHAAFAAALFAEEATKLQGEALRISENAIALTKARLAAGDALSEDVARVEMEQVRARLEYERARSLRDQAFLDLAGAIGNPSIRLEAVEGSLDAALEIPTLESAVAGLDQNPLLASADAAVAVERARVELAKAQRVPDVNLDVLYRRIGETDTNSFDVGLSIRLPVFDRNQGRIRETEADVRAADARKWSVRNDLERRLRSAHLKLSRAVAQAKVLREEILPRSEIVQKGAEARYGGGDISLADVLPIRRERTAVRLAYLESLREVLEAWAELRAFLR